MVADHRASPEPPDTAKASEPTVGAEDYWRVLLEEIRLTRDRQDARYGRLEVTAGVVLAAGATVAVARLSAPRGVDWFDLAFVIFLFIAMLLAFGVIWPQKRPSFDPDETRLAIQAIKGRSAAALMGGLYKDGRRANLDAEEAFGEVYKRFRYALIALALAIASLVLPTLGALLVSGEVPGHGR